MPPSAGDYIGTKAVGSGKDYATVGAAVDYWWSQFANLGIERRGKILIDPQTYDEMLCVRHPQHEDLDCGGYDGGTGYSLPPYVDLIAASGRPEIVHSPPENHTSAGLVRFCGGNYFEDIKIQSIGGYVTSAIQNAHYAYSDTVECNNIIAYGMHGGIDVGNRNLIANDLDVTTKYGSGIICKDLQLTGTNVITVYMQSNLIESSGGLFCHSGKVDNLTINCNQSASYRYEGALIHGISYYGTVGNLLILDNLSVNMTINNIYKSDGKWLYFSGIHSGRNWTHAASDIYPGSIILRDSSISLTCTEEATAKGVKVAGICNRGGSNIFVQNSTIATSNDNGSGEAESENYDLKRENGTLRINQANTSYANSNGTIEKLKYMVA